MLQAQYRDEDDTVHDLKRLNKEGNPTPYQTTHWFGIRPKEELYDLATDPHQVNNLAGDSQYGDELLRHRQILEN